MVTITAQMVKDLREMTGAGPLDCKKALEQTEGFAYRPAAHGIEVGELLFFQPAA